MMSDSPCGYLLITLSNFTKEPIFSVLVTWFKKKFRKKYLWFQHQQGVVYNVVQKYEEAPFSRQGKMESGNIGIFINSDI